MERVVRCGGEGSPGGGGRWREVEGGAGGGSGGGGRRVAWRSACPHLRLGVCFPTLVVVAFYPLAILFVDMISLALLLVLGNQTLSPFLWEFHP